MVQEAILRGNNTMGLVLQIAITICVGISLNLARIYIC